jgi:hypothetical protein
MTGLSTNDELEIAGLTKLSIFKYFLELLRITMRNQGQYIRFPGRDSTRVSPEDESLALPVSLTVRMQL